MKLPWKIALVSAVHFGLSMVIYGGLLFSHMRAARLGLTEVGPVGEFLGATARIIKEPAVSVVGPYIDRESLWIWSVPAANSLFWGSIFVLAFVVVRRRAGGVNT